MNKKSTPSWCRMPTSTRTNICPSRAERLAWLTGFTGSAGAAVILAESAHLFVDGRYTLQAAAQTDHDLITCHDLIETPPDKWLTGNLGTGKRVGFDPWLHTIAGVERLRKACEKVGAELVALDRNPVDAIRNDLPAGAARTGIDASLQIRR